MIFEGTEDEDAPPPLPDIVSGRDLLAACAAEVSRQAAAFAALDRTMGKVLGLVQLSAAANREIVSGLLHEMQGIDRLRQECEGLARTMAVLAVLPSLSSPVQARDVLELAAVGDLQRRLLSQRSVASGERREDPTREIGLP